MTGAIRTAKYHDGFCLSPGNMNSHTVANSPSRGHGDVVAGVAAGRHATRMEFGVYLSPWDRHEPTYGTGGPTTTTS